MSAEQRVSCPRLLPKLAALAGDCVHTSHHCNSILHPAVVIARRQACDHSHLELTALSPGPTHWKLRPFICDWNKQSYAIHRDFDDIKRWLRILPVQWPRTLIIRLSPAPWHANLVPEPLWRGGPDWDEEWRVRIFKPGIDLYSLAVAGVPHLTVGNIMDEDTPRILIIPIACHALSEGKKPARRHRIRR